MTEQTLTAIAEAEALLFLIDARAGRDRGRRDHRPGAAQVAASR